MSDYLHQELLSQFLKKLPAKTLIRCRSVCKWWKQVTDSRSFIADHLSLQKPRLLLTNEAFKYLIIDPQTLPKFDTLRGPTEPGFSLWPKLVCCVLGVICLLYLRSLHLWNPSIHRLSTIPLNDILNCPISKQYNDWIGFWIDPSNNHSKIVIIRREKRKISLFSSEKRVWEEFDSDIPELGESNCARSHVLINGVAHWTAYKKGSWKGVVAYFDFMEDKFGIIDMPDEASRNSNVFNWKDFLSLLYWVNGARWACECHLWVMQNGLWAKMFIFQHDDSLIDVLYADTVLSRILVQTDNYHLVLYDPEIGRKRIAPRSEFINLLEFDASYGFVESLVFPDLKCISSN